MLDLIVYAWTAWIGANAALLCAGVLFVRPPYPYCDGVKARVPEELRQVLTEAEFNAVVEHERGHLRCGHVWINLVRAWFFLPYTEELRYAQEVEADDCVSDPMAMAAALHKLPLHYGHEMHKTDWLRIMRLNQRGRDARGPRVRDGRTTREEGASKCN